MQTVLTLWSFWLPNLETFYFLLNGTFTKITMFICMVCHNKMPQTKWFKELKILSYTSQGWGVQDQDLASKTGLVLSSHRLACRWLLSHHAYMTSLYAGKATSLWALLKRTKISWDHDSTLMTSFNLDYFCKVLIFKYTHSEAKVKYTNRVLGFPGSSFGKESACNVGDCLPCRRPKFDL